MSAIKVLLVDDDEVIRSSLSGVLEQSGFSVTTAPNVPKALKLISHYHTGGLFEPPTMSTLDGKWGTLNAPGFRSRLLSTRHKVLQSLCEQVINEEKS